MTHPTPLSADNLNAGARSRVAVQPPPNLGDKLLRGIWAIVWLVLYRPTPSMAHGWRRFLLRVFGATIAPAAHPYPSAKIWAPWNLVMGSRSCLGPGANCYSAAKITLEADSVVSQGAHLCSASHDFRDPGFALVTGPIVVGKGAWVAAEAFVGAGVTIGAKAVVGARAVVTRDVSPGSVVAGNPARQVAIVDASATTDTPDHPNAR